MYSPSSAATASGKRLLLSCLALLFSVTCLTVPSHAQNLTFTIALGGSIDVPGPSASDPSNPHYYLNSAPSDARATMARVSADRVSVYPYGSANFQSDNNFTYNRIYAGEILRISGGTVPDGVTFTISYIRPIPSGPTYTITVNVKKIPSVVSLNSVDANPTGALYVHWQAVFDRPIANVTAANLLSTIPTIFPQRQRSPTWLQPWRATTRPGPSPSIRRAATPASWA